MILIDDGTIVEIDLDNIHPLIEKFCDRPAQAVACSLAEVSNQ